ncbi:MULTISPECIES: NAD(P)-dependent oxidoreductase [Chryseobacterium]|uniref:NADH-flavin reductase n=1 Tax=Chryseobacterium geocarposphaerae TaxID=1416776 RepID=A0ABU1LHP4_9FLAO|nr:MULTISPECIES: NAD(P)-dependent oxidoreductase [Chryseobacterium]MDR6406065.1 putative NADH-flavin reductase [Chryseobacterium geocarposphaerae]MDR6699461.1 putative NADH-flavin reductase [Chryseobacterium ginsenosidimutans]
MKKVAVIGATGFVGTQVVNELLNRGYEVEAIVRDASKVQQKDKVTAKSVDVNNIDELAGALQGTDAVISAFNAGWTNPNLYEDFLNGSINIEKAVEKSGVKRLITVGGAGSLYIDGNQLVDSPEFPAEYKPGATAARDYLNKIKENKTLDWTFFSPAIEMNAGNPGERTGKYRTALENPVFDDNGRSVLSVEDVAVALVDELEQNNHIRQRFTAAY